jgi:hypothetical protein
MRIFSGFGKYDYAFHERRKKWNSNGGVGWDNTWPIDRFVALDLVRHLVELC